MAYPDTVVRKRKIPTGFVAGEPTKSAPMEDDDCGCNDSDLEEEEVVQQKKRKIAPDDAKKPKGADEPKKKKKKVAKAEPKSEEDA
jgi:hypothetical protein